MSELAFGVGSLWSIAATDVTGAAITNPTPVKFGTMQDFVLNVDFTLKELHSRFQIPIAAARGSAKLSWTAKFAQINTSLFHAIYFGNTGAPTVGAYTVADSESKTVPTTPFSLAPTNIATINRDLGVRYDSTGLPLVAATIAPTVGQYVWATPSSPAWTASFPYILGQQIQPVVGNNAGGYVYMAVVAGTSGGTTPATFNQTIGNTTAADGAVTWLNVGLPGSYLFNTADSTLVVRLDYVYVPAYGYRTTFTSQTLGNAPTFGIVARGTYLGAPITIRLDNNVSNKLTLPRKVDDWLIASMDGSAFMNNDSFGATAGFISVNNSL